LPVSLMNLIREMFLLSGREMFLNYNIGKKANSSSKFQASRGPH
jgi:hypothetical protein